MRKKLNLIMVISALMIFGSIAFGQERRVTVTDTSQSAGPKVDVQSKQHEPKTTTHEFDNCCTRTCTSTKDGEDGSWSKGSNGMWSCSGKAGPLTCPSSASVGGNDPKSTPELSPATKLKDEKVVIGESSKSNESGSNSPTTKGKNPSISKTNASLAFDPKTGNELAPTPPQKNIPRPRNKKP